MPGRWRPRQRWGAGVLVATVALLALVAVVAEGAPLEAPRGDGTLRIDLSILVLAFGVALVAGLVLLLVGIWSMFTGRAVRHGEPRKRTWWHLVLTVALLTLVVLVTGDLRRPPPVEEEPSGPGDGQAEQAVEDPREAPVWPVVVLGVVFAGALAAASLSNRRPGPAGEVPEAPPAPEHQRRAARAAFDASLDDLRAEPDPRRAVIAAYAGLLARLDGAGLGRRPHEAPVEHLERALVHLDVPPAPLRTLVALFEEARFSTHTLHQAHKDTAIEAFEAARAGLPEPLVSPG